METGKIKVNRKPIKKQLEDRLNYLIGHLKANLKMVQEDRYCIDIIRQNQAVIAALEKVNEILLRSHLNTCVTTAVRGKSEKERKRVLSEIVEIFKEESR
jgi:DNA-binding FrmR family transcriptional regulator